VELANRCFRVATRAHSPFFFTAAQVLPQRAWPSPTTTSGLVAKRCRAEGSAIGIVAPFRVPWKRVLLQGKRLGVHDSAPFWGPGWTRLALSTPCEVLPHGGIAFADHHGAGLPGGPTKEMMAPSRGP
jgi:hypothetical protein